MQTTYQKEILDALKHLHNCKTPGTDGFPPDFYKFFLLDIKLILIESIEYAIVTGELSVEQKGESSPYSPPQNMSSS